MIQSTWRGTGVMTEKVEYTPCPEATSSLLPSFEVKEMFLLPARPNVLLGFISHLLQLPLAPFYGIMSTNQQSPPDPCSTLVLLSFSPFLSVLYLNEFYFLHCLGPYFLFSHYLPARWHPLSVTTLVVMVPDFSSGTVDRKGLLYVNFSLVSITGPSLCFSSLFSTVHSLPTWCFSSGYFINLLLLLPVSISIGQPQALPWLQLVMNAVMPQMQ